MMPRWWRCIQIVVESVCAVTMFKAFVWDCLAGNVPEGINIAFPVAFGILLTSLFCLLVAKNVHLLRKGR